MSRGASSPLKGSPIGSHEVSLALSSLTSPKPYPIVQNGYKVRSEMREDTKLAKVRQAMRDGDWRQALKLAARFRRLGEHREAIQRAANAISNPSFYEELGYDLKEIEAEGIAALKKYYSKSWQEVQEQ
jgi:hypothetical protein